MGARGPGAKPVGKGKGAVAARPGKALWQRKGLSRADRVIAFIESLKITSGEHAGKPFILRPWQRDIVKAIYGPVGENRRRLIRQALLTIPRKNGKTGLAAALCLVHLVGPEAEQRGQVYSAAADRDQAALIFREMEAMLLADSELAARVNIQRFAKRIEDSETGSVYQALSSDARKAHGLSASCVIYDELAQSKDRHLYDNLLTSTGARAEPLFLVISTQSSDPHHVMSEIVGYGQQVLEGIISDPSFLPVIYAAPMDADPWDEAVWYACNPALGDFRSLDEMRSFAESAKRIPAKESVFRALYLNQPVDADQRFISSADWEACAGAVDPEALRGRPCWAGLDLSSTTDLTALVLYFPHDNGAILPFFWVPGDRLAEREDRDRVPYRTWAAQGHIEPTQGRAIDKLAIVRRLAELQSRFDIQGIAYDRWRIEDLKKLLADEGIESPLVDWGQGFRDMGPAVDALEALILDARLRHDRHPVLTWNVSNAVVTTDPAGARKVAKDKAIERVDGLVALVMAVGLAAREPEPVVYDFDRPLVLSA